MKRPFRTLLLSAALAVAVIAAGGGCASAPERVIGVIETTERLWKMQTCQFETEDALRIQRAALATLQLYGYIFEQAEPRLGLLSGTAYPSAARISVIVLPVGSRMQVRTTIQFKNRVVSNPNVYRRCFELLSRELELSAIYPNDPASGVFIDRHGNPRLPKHTQPVKMAHPGEDGSPVRTGPRP